MCDYFWPRMENGHGDLADIVRAGGRIGLENTGLEPAAQLQLTSDPVVFPAINESPTHNFGHPFVDLRGPLLSQVDMSVEFFDAAETMVPPAEMAMEVSGSGRGGGGRFLAAQKVLSSEQERHCNIFSRVLQIPPVGSNPSQLSPRLIKPSSLVAGEMMKVSSGSTANPVGQYGDEVQISPPQTPGIKRRKNQAKKVVCIPAPAPASSRPSGEVIPSDLWAWRKYGQKPIKGSPHPRGYYRCSSSKGCSARKQVERSRTDPNILVITYTSEHNHPWPTQRNALAGSTRSHPCKNAVKSSNDSILKPPTDPKEKPEEATSSSAHLVKEDVAAEMEKAIEPAEENELRQSYDPMNISEEDQPDTDFFADLAELESDPVSLIFSKGFMETKPDGVKALDPFSTFEYWAGSS